MKKFVLLFSGFYFFIFPLFSQKRDIDKMHHKKRHKVAHKMIQSGSHFKAIDHLKKLVEDHPDNPDYAYKLGEAYLASRDYNSAEKWFEKALDLNNSFNHRAGFKLGVTKIYLGEYDKALESYKKFYDAYTGTRVGYYKNLARRGKRFAKNAKKYDAISNPEITMDHIGSIINSGYSDFGPEPVGDSILYFSSLRADTVVTVDYGETHFNHVKLFKAQKKDGEWKHPQEINKLNTTFESNANGTFSPDRKKFYFSRCIPDKKNNMKCNIYVSKVKNGEFQEPKKLGNHINGDDFTSTQPEIATIRKHGKEVEIMYFVSDKRGGHGGLDIWYARYDERTNQFSSPKNLDGTVNSSGNDITPFYDNKNNTLYFSSNQYYGLGGYDIYKAEGNKQRFKNRKHLGKKFNTSTDDYYFTYSDNRLSGYLVSNRPGGLHMVSETCCDDIYSFKKEAPSFYKLAFKAKDTSLPLKNLSFEIKNKPVIKDSAVNISFENQKYFKDKAMLSYLGIPSKDSLYKLKLNHHFQINAHAKGFDTINVQFQTNTQGKITMDSSAAEFLEVASLWNEKATKDKLITVALPLLPKDTTAATDTAAADTTIVAKENRMAEKSGFTLLNNMNRDTKKSIDSILDKTYVIYFNFDKSDYIKKYEKQLNFLVKVLKRNPSFKVKLKSYTDSKGTEEYNQELSDERAKTIYNFLKKNGIKGNRIFAKGFGEKDPVAPNKKPDGSDNPAGRALNRRCEIEILD